MKNILLTLLLILPIYSLSAMEIGYSCTDDSGIDSALVISKSEPGSFYEYSAQFISEGIVDQFEGSLERDDNGTRFYHLNEVENARSQIMVEKFNSVGTEALLYKITVLSATDIQAKELSCVITSIKK